MPGFGAIGELALGEVQAPAAATVFTNFSQWPVKKVAAVVIAATFTGFVAPPPPAQAKVFSTFQTIKTRPVCQVVWSFVPPPAAGSIAVFSTFSRPLPKPTFARNFIASFEIFPPQPPPFTGFARFEAVIRAKPNVALFGNFKPFPIILPVVDTHDGVFVKRKSKRREHDLIKRELEEKAARRAAIELAIYGPPVEYKEPPTVFAAPPPALPDVAELAKVIAAVQAAHHQALRTQAEQDDETELEAILREIL